MKFAALLISAARPAHSTNALYFASLTAITDHGKRPQRLNKSWVGSIVIEQLFETSMARLRRPKRPEKNRAINSKTETS